MLDFIFSRRKLWFCLLLFSFIMTFDPGLAITNQDGVSVNAEGIKLSNTIIPATVILGPGMKGSAGIEANGIFPLDMGNVIVVCLDKGDLSIELANNQSGRILGITTIGFTEDFQIIGPVFRIGWADGVKVKLSNLVPDGANFGYAWITSGILLASDSEDSIPYKYTVKLSH